MVVITTTTRGHVSGHGCNHTHFENNDCHHSEREIMRAVKRLAVKDGYRPSGREFSEWFSRKMGKLVVFNHRADGTIGPGLPCTMCRKMLERDGIGVITTVSDSEIYCGSIDRAPSSKLSSYIRSTGDIPKYRWRVI